MPEMPLVSVVTSRPLPGGGERGTRPIDPRVVSVEVDTEDPGGFGRARIGLYRPEGGPLVYPRLPEPVEVEDRMHVEVWAGSACLHMGVVQSAALDGSGFESLGYGLVAPNWGVIEQGTATSVSAGRLAAAAIRASAGVLTPSAVEESGVTHTWAQFVNQSGAQVLETLGKEGGLDKLVPWSFLVYDDLRATFTPALVPDAPDYLLSYDPDTMGALRADYSDIWDAVKMTFRTAGGGTNETDWVYRAGVDRTSRTLRRKVLPASVPDGTLALQFLRTWLAAHAGPTISGSITLSSWARLTTPTGGARYAYLARAGEAVEIEGYGRGRITKTTSNLFTGSTRLTLGDPPTRTLAAMIRRWRATDVALRTDRDPTTGYRMAGIA